MQCMLFVAAAFLLVARSEIIFLVYERGDYYAASIVEHLNISHMYFKEQTGAFLQPKAVVLDSNETTEFMCDEITNVSLIISLARTPSQMQTIIEMAELSKIPVVQILFEPWSLSNASTAIALPTHLPNYVGLVLPSLVFQSSLLDIAPLMGIRGDFVVLRDDVYSRGFNSWRPYFNRLPGNVTYKNLATVKERIHQQISVLLAAEYRRTIIFVATTENIMRWVTEAQPAIDAGQLRMFAMTKDITAFECDECTAVDMFWIRPYSTNKVQDIRDYNDFIVKNEINTELHYTIKAWDELDVSFFYDIMNATARYIKAVNATYAGGGYAAFNCVLEPENTTLPMIPFLTARVINEYGVLVKQADNILYEDVPVRVYRIFRNASTPDEKYNKMMANWSTTTGLQLYYSSLTQMPYDINFYRVATIQQPPFIQLAADGTFTGYCIDMMEMIAAQLNLSYVIYEVEDGSFGTIDDNGNWNGMMGALVSGSADIALGPFSVTSERENDVDFTVPFYDLVGTSILMKKTETQYSLFRFLDVLEWPVWMCIIGAYLFTSALLWLFERFSPYSYSNNRERYKDDVEKREFSLKECLWFCMTSLTPQGGGEAPKNISGRLVAATWWLFGFIIIASYTANLAAFLTVSRLEQQIKSLDDLAKQYKIEYAPTKGSASETYFRRMAEIEERFYVIWKEMSLNESMTPRDRARLAVWDYPVSDKYTNMWRYMQECGLPESIGDAIHRVLTSTEGFAYIGDATEIKYATLTNCQLQQIGTEFSRKPFAMATQTGHPLKNPISNAILFLMNNRKLETLKDKWWGENPSKAQCRLAEEEGEGISIDNIGGVFIVILAGIVIALIILVFEYYYYRNAAKRVVADRKKHTPASSPASSSVINLHVLGRSLEAGPSTTPSTDETLPVPSTSSSLRRRGSHAIEDGKKTPVQDDSDGEGPSTSTRQRRNREARYENPAYEKD